MTTNAFWLQGEIQAGRVLPRPHALDLDHTQAVLWPVSVLEARIRIGWLPEEDHVRWQIEVIDPSTTELLAMTSTPHRRLSEVGYVPTSIMRRLEEILPPLFDPEPF